MWLRCVDVVAVRQLTKCKKKKIPMSHLQAREGGYQFK